MLNLKPKPQQQEDDFREMELWEHLQELRSRLVRSILYIVVGATIAWIFYEGRTFHIGGRRQVIGLLPMMMAPMERAMDSIGGEWAYRHIMDAFMMKLKMSFLGGLIVALPLVSLELWGFIAPGLTRKERKVFHRAVPLSLFFFALGVAVAYFAVAAALSYFATFFKVGGGLQDFRLLQDPAAYMGFVTKLLLAFGLVFQLPVVLMFLAYIGFVTSGMMVRGWKFAMVGSVIVAAIVTPTPDAFTMSMMAVPLMALYFLSIFLVRYVEGRRTASPLAA